MATGNNRDVRLGIEVATTGEDDLKRLAGAVRALGKEGDPAANEYARLANELDRLANQSGAVQALRALRTDVELLAVAERDATAAAAAASARFNEQTAAATALRETQVLARAEAGQAKAALAELTAELDRQVIANKAAGQSGKQLAASTEEARLRIVDQKLALEQRNRALAEANAAVSAAEASERRLGAQFTATNAAADSTIAALSAQSAALTQAAAAATALGVEIADLAAVEAHLAAAARDNAAEAGKLGAQAAESAAAMQTLESAARQADAQMEALAASLRETEAAARKFTQATERAAAAGADDVSATRARVGAADALIASERALTVGQAELAAGRDRNRAALLAEAQALLTTQRAMEAGAAATQRMVAEARALGTALDSSTGLGAGIARIGTLAETAFGQVGVRSLQAIEAEVARTERAMFLLQSEFRAGAISAKDLERAIGAATVKLSLLQVEARSLQSLPGQFERINASITGVISKFGALGAAFATVGIVARPILDATVALNQMQRVLTTVTGSAEAAQKQIDFLRVVSRESGQQFDTLGKTYTAFAASALQSGLTIKQTQTVFRDVALAAGNLGLSTDEVTRALQALSQMASKGVVTMEELRQQLGDALPGVLPLLAKELGLTQQELFKLINNSQLLATEGIPAIGRSLKALHAQGGAQVEGLVASWNRFVNVVKQAGTEITDGPIGRAVAPVLQALAAGISFVAVQAVTMSEGIRVAGESLAAVAAAATGAGAGFGSLGKEIERLGKESAERLEKFKTTAYGAAGGTKALADETAKLGPSFARLSIDIDKAVAAAELQVQVSTKRVQAAEAEGKATVALAGLIGDETAARNGAVVAAVAIRDATLAQAKADETVAAALIAGRDAIIANAKAQGTQVDAIKALVEEYDKKIAKAQADVEKTRAQADAAREHAAAMELAAEAAKDNSKRIGELKVALIEAKAAQVEVTLRYAAGKAALDDVKKATDAVAKAKGLLRDAIDDVSAALERQLAALRADAKLSEASLKLDLERARSAEREALARGNEAAARQAAIRVKELEIALSRIGIDLKLQEAEATLRALDVEERELKLSGQLTDEKLAAIEVKRKTALALVLEAEANREANKEKSTEIDLVRRGGTARKDYNDQIARTRKEIEGDTTSTQTNTGTRERNAGVIDRQTDALVNYEAALRRATSAAGISSDSAADDKRRNSANSKAGAALGGDPFFDLLAKMKAGGLEGGDLAIAKAVFENMKHNLTVVQQSTGAFTLAAREDASAQYNQARRILDIVESLAAQVPAPTGQRTVTTPASTPIGGTASGSGSNVNVTLNFGGASATLTGTQAQADAFLRLLEEARRSAGGGG